MVPSANGAPVITTRTWVECEVTVCTKFVEEGSQLRHPKLNGLGEVALFPIEMHVLATALIWSGRLRSLLASLEHGGHTTAAPPTAWGGASLLRREGFARRGGLPVALALLHVARGRRVLRACFALGAQLVAVLRELRALLHRRASHTRLEATRGAKLPEPRVTSSLFSAAPSIRARRVPCSRVAPGRGDLACLLG
jgi:hypothetical protein